MIYPRLQNPVVEEPTFTHPNTHTSTHTQDTVGGEREWWWGGERVGGVGEVRVGGEGREWGRGQRAGGGERQTKAKHNLGPLFMSTCSFWTQTSRKCRAQKDHVRELDKTV